jgi:outer membrane lipoprotein-sorting protein
MAILKISFILFVLLFWNCVFSINQEQIKADIITFYSNVKTYEAQFQQTNYWSGANLSRQSTGTLYFNDEKLILSYDEPDNQMLIVENNSVVLYLPNSNQAILSSQIDVLLRPAELIEHFWANANDITSETNTDSLFITLKTKNNEHIKMKFYQNKLIQLQILDADKNKVRYNFQTIKMNKSIKKEILDFELPESVQFIDTRNR